MGKKRIDEFQPPLPKEILQQYNFFELYPFDGGGHFIQLDMVHSIDDREIVKNILSGALNIFKDESDHINYLKFERWKTIEQSCWINRMYFTASMGRVAFLDQKVELALKTIELILDFHNRYKRPKTKKAVAELNKRVFVARNRDYNSGNADGATEYQWYDFQPASRIINVLHTMFFLRNFKQIADDQWKKLDEFIWDNATTIADGEEQDTLYKGNHQALRGLALLYAGQYFHCQRFTDLGNKICNFHMVQDYIEDGMLIDMSPSYHLFEAWIGRDAAFFGKIEQPAMDMLHKAFHICSYFRCPHKQSIVLNDGYELNMDGFLTSIQQQNSVLKEEFVLPFSHVAFLNTKNFYAVLDGTLCESKFSHYHGGKCGVTLWSNQKAFLIDSGCCSYDDPDFSTWFKRPEAHSTLLVDEKGDAVIQGRYEWLIYPEIKVGDWQNNSIEMQHKSTAPGWRDVFWKRALSHQDHSICFMDIITASEEHEYKFLFVLSPDVTCSINGKEIELTNGNEQLIVTWESSMPIDWKLTAGKVIVDLKKQKNQILTGMILARNCFLKIRLEQKKNDEPF